MKQPILVGKHVTLRPMKLSDAPNYVKWFNDQDVIKYLSVEELSNIESERKYIRKVLRDKKVMPFSIITADKKHIGSFRLTLNQINKNVNFGLIIGDKKEWGKGYGEECLLLACDYVFEKLKFHRFDLEVVDGNSRAIKLYKKIGFKLEGRKREFKWFNKTKQFVDQLTMGMLRDDWLNKNK